MDSHFLKECIAGKPKAQQKLYDLYAPKMFAICYRYAIDKYMAEEMMQEGFIKIYQNLSMFKDKGSFEGWMFRIMVNTALAFLRKDKKTHQQLSIDKEYSGVQVMPSILNDVSVKEIIEAIRSLPYGYREVVNLYILDGYSHQEIADILGISKDNSKQRLKRGRAMLQRKILDMNYIPDESI